MLYFQITLLSPLKVQPNIYLYNGLLVLHQTNLKILLKLLLLFPFILHSISRYYLTPLLSEIYLLLFSV